MRILAGVIALLLVQSCYYDKEEELYPGNCNVLNPTYTNGIKTMIDNNCATSGCHTGIAPAAGLLLNTYPQVKEIAVNGKLEARVIIQKSMPPSGPLPKCDLEALQVWIAAGAPEN
jgi:hypothetical protein